MAFSPPKSLLRPLTVKGKTLMGPGPSNCPPRVLHALSQPVLGPCHEATFQLMDEIKEGIQYIFQTRNTLTLAISGSGHSGIEASLCNLIEPGEKVLILANGFWASRAADMATRCGGKVVKLEVPLGTNLTPDEVAKAMDKEQPAVLFVTHGESSTGVLQPIDQLGAICRKHDCLLVVDTVASLGGVNMFAEAWEIDCVYTGSQKVLGAPPGMTPISFGKRAELKIQKRKTPISIYNLDMLLLGQYWACYPNQPRIYHHTISSTLLYGLREALAMVAEEGIENCISRHQRCAEQLHTGLTKLGFEFFVRDPSARLPTLTTVKVPYNINWQQLIKFTLSEYDFEISGGLGGTIGKVLRIGVMGQNANSQTVDYCLKVLEKALTQCRL